MKYRTILTALLAVVGLNAAELDYETEKLLETQAESTIYHENFSRRFIPYIKLGPEMANLGKQNTIMPGGGIGIRSESEKSAVDCSWSYAMVQTEDNKQIINAFAPKLVYLRYLNSHSPSALFAGFGGTWAFMQNQVRNEEFNGLAAVASAGIEYNRSSRIRQIYQIDLHQPVIGLTPMKNGYPMPVVEMSFALGF